jgi:hypothetical protein
MNFLCTTCKASLCPDCKSIADEYETLLQSYKRTVIQLQADKAHLQSELELVKRHAKYWEEIAKLGLPEVIIRWMDETAH